MRVQSLLAAAAAALAMAAPALAQDSPPDWLKRPSLQDIMGVYPSGAIQHGANGKALISCIVTLEGTLRDCHVVSESPPGQGFGAAAITLTPQLLMKPALRGGKPVESSVRIPFEFPSPSFTTGSHVPGGSPLQGIPTKVYSNIPWSQAPSVADVVAAFPKKAREQKVSGRATVDCAINREGGLFSCTTLNEEPRDYGFASAAHVLAHRFQGPTTDGKGHSLQGAHTQVLMAFPADYLSNPSPTIGRPQWAALPTAEDFNAAYPAAAGKAGVLKARVVLNCQVDAGGVLGDCHADSEEPAGYGFGPAAASLSGKFRVSAWTAEGLPTVGGRVSVPIRYELQQVPQAAAPAK